jgi:hypothetical protein
MKRYWLFLAVLAAGSAQAWDCNYDRELEVTLNLDGSERLTLNAAAGDMRIIGRPDITEARARGRVCASEEDWLEASRIVTQGGRAANITISLPDTDSGWTLAGKPYVYMDLEIDVPAALDLEVRGSSGNLAVQDTGAITIKDSSGGVDLENVHGDVRLEGASGDIELQAVTGDVTVRANSTGAIEGREIHGSVRVAQDSSGDIRFENVSGDFTVERDSSGDIVAENIGGDFQVLQNGSGAISSRNVTGKVEVPDQG